jgi:hypothetical protein
MVAEVFDILLNLTDSVLYILLVKLTACVSFTSCMLLMLCLPGWAAKLKDRCDIFQALAVYLFEDVLNNLTILCCISIDPDASEAVRGGVVLPISPKWIHISGSVYELSDQSSKVVKSQSLLDQ